MNDMMEKIALHYDKHRRCGIDICPMIINEYEAYQLTRYLKALFVKPLQDYPKPGDRLQCHGVTLIVVED